MHRPGSNLPSRRSLVSHRNRSLYAVKAVALTAAGLLALDSLAGTVYRTDFAPGTEVVPARSGTAKLLVVFPGFIMPGRELSRAFAPHLGANDAMIVVQYAERGMNVDAIYREARERVRVLGAQFLLGQEPIVLPEPLDDLVRQLIATRRGHAAIGDHGTSPWLFPGGQPGRPISSFRLAERLRELGIHSGQARSAALFQLATDLPAAVLARMLGIHIAAAVAWQRASAGDWTNYAAEVSRRI